MLEERDSHDSKKRLKLECGAAIAPASPNQQQTIESLVAKILTAKQHDSASDVSQWEPEIDTIVYQLYELTDAEIAIVRGEYSNERPKIKRYNRDHKNITLIYDHTL